jgi:hypothetical protein
MLISALFGGRFTTGRHVSIGVELTSGRKSNIFAILKRLEQ